MANTDKTATPVAENEVPAENEATEAKPEKDTMMVAVSVPIEFKSFLDEKSKEQKITTARLVRNIVAAELGYDLSAFESRVRTRSSKFASEDERNAAKKAAATKRADTIKALMAKYKAGEITL